MGQHIFISLFECLILGQRRYGQRDLNRNPIKALIDLSSTVFRRGIHKLNKSAFASADGVANPGLDSQMVFNRICPPTLFFFKSNWPKVTSLFSVFIVKVWDILKAIKF